MRPQTLTKPKKRSTKATPKRGRKMNKPEQIQPNRYIDAIMAVNRFIRRRMITILFCAVTGIWLHLWNTEDVRDAKVAHPYLETVCFTDWYAGNMIEHLRDARWPETILIREDMKMFRQVVSEKCYARYDGLTKWQRFVRDWQTGQNTVTQPDDATPPAPNPFIQAGYEGTAP